MPSLNDALAYGERSLAIIPVHLPLPDGSCSCPLGSRCKSPGKHPLSDLAPHGVHDASANETDIRRFFANEANIGVACGVISGNLMVQDIDDEEAVERLLQPEVGLADVTLCDSSGRGIHIWLYTTGDTKGINLIREGGGPIGELRGDGQYVVAPPSQHYSGKTYTWLNPDQPILVVDDAKTFVTDLLWKAGVQVASGSKYDDLEIPDVAVLPIDLPVYLEDEADIKRLVKRPLTPPGALKPDRSKSLYILAHQMVELAWLKHNQRLTMEGVAGILKRIDANVTGYQKYSTRNNPDRNYLLLGAVAVKDLSDKLKTSVRAGDYVWDGNESRLFLDRGKDGTTIANFLPLIEEALEIDKGEDVEPARAYTLTMSRGEQEVRVVLTEKEADPYQLRKAVFRSCPADFIVEDGQWGKLWTAAQSMSQEMKSIRHRKSFMHQGWITDGEPKFLMVGLDGAITKSGIDTSVRFEGEDIPESLKGYGQTVRPASTPEEWQAAAEFLMALAEAGKPEIVVPIIAQVSAGPLFSLGLNSSPPLVHVTGESGAFKTSYNMAALSMYGQFGKTRPPETYASTTAALAERLNYMRDLTLLIDNYIPGIISNPDLIRMIQAYGDGLSRSRLNSDSSRRKTYAPRGLWLSTGESVWGDMVSARARTLIIWIGRGDINGPKLALAQAMISAGLSGILGGSYIAWLAAQGFERVKARVEAFRVTAIAAVSHIGEKHERPVQSLASLIAAFQMFLAFVRETMPGVADDLADIGRAGIRPLVNSVNDDAADAEELSAFNQLCEGLRSSLAAGTVRLDGRTSDDRMVGLQFAEIVGWIDDQFVYLGKDATFGWYLRLNRTQGLAPMFNWGSFVNEAKQKYAADSSRVFNVGGKSIRLIAIPRAAVLVDATDQTVIL